MITALVWLLLHMMVVEQSNQARHRLIHDVHVWANGHDRWVIPDRVQQECDEVM